MGLGPWNERDCLVPLQDSRSMVISTPEGVTMHTVQSLGPAAAGHRSSDQVRALHEIKTLAQRDESFAHALKASRTTQEAVHVARRRGIAVTPEALWRHRGTLMAGGVPTWRG